MSLNNSQYEAIMRQYNQKQLRNERTRNEHRRIAYTRIPRLTQIDEETASYGASRIRDFLSGTSGMSDAEDTISRLSEEKKRLLSENGFPQDYLELSYDCPLCQDTGFRDGQKCSCLKKAEIEMLYGDSNLGDILKKENFESFSFEYYSDKISSGKKEKTVYDLACEAHNTAVDFVSHFDSGFTNLFLSGPTGVGKSFLSHCISGELIKTSHSVLYFSAVELFDILADSTFKSGEHISADYIYDCDLLVIDDLGTELTNTFVVSQLFTCINQRHIKRKPTIISTNLSLEQIRDQYSERISSRIIGSYTVLYLAGEDIRLQKKRRQIDRRK